MLPKNHIHQDCVDVLLAFTRVDHGYSAYAVSSLRAEIYLAFVV
jgi:hypothetical protein